MVILLLIILLLILSNPAPFLEGLAGKARQEARIPARCRKRAQRVIPLEIKALIRRVGSKGGIYKAPAGYTPDFLRFCSDFFKFKRHEWSIVAFACENSVSEFWAVKGSQAKTNIGISETGIAELCSKNGWNKVIFIHNHRPVGNESIAELSKPSINDRYVYASYAAILKEKGVESEFYLFVAGKMIQV